MVDAPPLGVSGVGLKCKKRLIEGVVDKLRLLMFPCSLEETSFDLDPERSGDPVISEELLLSLLGSVVVEFSALVVDVMVVIILLMFLCQKL